MHPELNYTIAKLHNADLIRAAERRRLSAELAAPHPRRRPATTLIRLSTRIVFAMPRAIRQITTYRSGRVPRDPAI
jgi:hypothetical protein